MLGEGIKEKIFKSANDLCKKVSWPATADQIKYEIIKRKTEN